MINIPDIFVVLDVLNVIYIPDKSHILNILDIHVILDIIDILDILDILDIYIICISNA